MELTVSNNGNHKLDAAIEAALMQGDLSKLSVAQRGQYVSKICEDTGLTASTQPFNYIVLNGKLTLYAKKDCTEQLRKLHGVSIQIVSRERVEDIYIVTARAKDKNGREDESIGAVSVLGLKAEQYANALMKAETKAKRRVTLSICGLGFLDDSETDSIKGAQIVDETWQPDPRIQKLDELTQLEEPERPEIVTTALPLENPWTHAMEMGKYKGKRLFEVPHDVLSQFDRSMRQSRITEADYVNIKDALENAHLKASAISEAEEDNADFQSFKTAIKGESNE
jgi:hypothetical protein